MSRSFPQVNSDKPLGGRYKIISQLGVGGFGRTFLADDLHLPGHPCCVVKQLKPQASSDDTLQMARRCFNTEAQVLYRLGSHDQIPRLLAHFEDGQEFYLAQEFIEGDPLAQELMDGRPWSEGRVIVLLKDILQVLVFVHEQQVIHRDLKPSNLIRRKHDRKIVLIDFGAVKQVGTQNVDPDSGLTNITISIGTQGYMPNEQLAGKPRFSSDIYAVGVLGIQALTGIHPKHLGDDIKGEIEWHDRVSQASPELIEILDRMVRYDFRERYPVASEALEALEKLPVIITDPSDRFQAVPEALRLHEARSAGSATTSGSYGPAYSDSGAIDWAMADEEPTETAIWLPTESLAQPLPNGTGLTQAVGGAPSADLSNASGSTAGTNKRGLLQPWLVLAAIAAIGLVFTVVQSVLPQFAQTQNRTDSPAVKPTPSPTASSTPLNPQQQAAALLTQATQLRQKKQYEEALQLYDKLIALKPDSAEAYAGRCETLNLLQRPEEAVVSCNDALAYKPNYALALWSMGNARLLQKRPYDALKLYEDVTYVKPDFAEGWVKRGVALQKLGRSSEALNSLDQGIQLQRNSVEAWFTRGAALLNLQRYDEAITSLDKALQLQPDNPDIKKLRQKAIERSRS
jgi:serine/threonine protein kinase